MSSAQINNNYLILQAPEIQNIVLFSDATERGGETTATLTEEILIENDREFEFKGILKGILLDNSKRVGFAGIRYPLQIQKEYTGASMSLTKEPTALIVRAVFTTQNTEVPQLEGDLTYQSIFEKNEKSGLYFINFAELKPVIRGREIPASKAPHFSPYDVLSFAIELKLSEQANVNTTDGLAFQLNFQ